MDNTTTKEVSDNVIEEAKLYADLCGREGSLLWRTAYESFIAGAYSQKPIEHFQTPENINDGTVQS